MRIFFLILILCSCSPQGRLNRLVKKYPHLLVKDTVVVRDTTIIKGSTKDSSFIFSSDTIVISDSNQIIKYFYNTHTQKHYIKGEVRDRIIYKDIKVPYEKVIVEDLPWYVKHNWIALLFFGVTMLLLITKRK